SNIGADFGAVFKKGTGFKYKEIINQYNENGEYIQNAISKEFIMKVQNTLSKNDTTIVFLNKFFDAEIFKNSVSPSVLIFTKDACYIGQSGKSWPFNSDADISTLNIDSLINKYFDLLIYKNQKYNRADNFEDSINYPFLVSTEEMNVIKLQNQTIKTAIYNFKVSTSHSTLKYKYSNDLGFIEYDFEYGSGVAMDGKFILIDIKKLPDETKD
ncbi:MAG: hypothetical protein ABIY35_01740, partial [Chitinophagaceae bacterium]